MRNKNIIPALLIFLVFSCCKPPYKGGLILSDETSCNGQNFNYTNQVGCDGQIYPNPVTSKYVLPFAVGETFKTGLTNCSRSYHGTGRPDRYAFDFDMPEGTPFHAARGGKVVLVINNQAGGSGNWCIIDHLDNTFGIYLHSPINGVHVEVGDVIAQGQYLGITGRSGLAGYPHLHFIVVKNGYSWPYDPIPVSFKNVIPQDVVLKSDTNYLSCSY